ncbi:ferritin-like domain-containing protein [Halobellus captivus]|uniref:ferritin-like domain-containing protein n=1 Tax=Halobellus captivus TaxID=2592614 RepID=UPI0011A17B5A|nr:ferritin-like domain-containing protein [Halobellus captivus]
MTDNTDPTPRTTERVTAEEARQPAPETEHQSTPEEQRATSETESRRFGDGSRRSFLGRSALVGGALVALGGATGSVFGQQEDDETDEADDAPMEATAAFDDVDGTDIDVLNYALSLEHLENAFYREALESFDEEDFVDAELLSEYDETLRTEILEHVETIAEHEATHVEVLTQAIELLGGTPAEEAAYDFGVETVDEFLELAQVLENTGVAAYQGAAPFVESPDLLSTALSIHSVEARHAALLNELTGESPFPDAFDSAQSQSEVLDAVEDLIGSEEDDDDEDENGEDDEADDEDDEADDEDEGDEEEETTTEDEGDEEEETTTEDETEAPTTESEPETTGSTPTDEGPGTEGDGTPTRFPINES